MSMVRSSDKPLLPDLIDTLFAFKDDISRLKSSTKTVAVTQAVSSTVTSSDVYWDSILAKPDTFPPSEHTHSQYLTGEVDPTVPEYVKDISEADISSWNSKMDPADYPDLVAIEALSGASGFLKKTGANTWVLDTNTYVTSVFGRTGDVVATYGDYTTAQVPESTNLYFTDSRARFALSEGALISYNPSTGLISHDVVGITAGLYGSSSTTIRLYIDAYGHVIDATPLALTPDWANITGKPSTFVPSAHTLDSHSNVTITSNTNGEILRWNGTAWINNTLAEAGIQPAGSYLTGNQTITLSGVVTGSGATSITTSIADGALSIAKTSGLQTALDAKMATASYPDLVAIEALSGTTGLLKKTAANTWILDTASYLTTSGTAAAATKLATGRTIGITGDATWTSPAFDGTANVTSALTLASVITAGGPTGGAATVPVITYDSKGRLTAVTTASITPAAIGASSTSHDHAHLNMGTVLEGSGDAFSSRASYDGRGGVRTAGGVGPFGSMWYNVVDVRHRNTWGAGDVYGGELVWGMTGAQNRMAFRSRGADGTPTSWTEVWTGANLVNPVTGAGASGQFALWNGSSTHAGSSYVTYDTTNGKYYFGGSQSIATYPGRGIYFDGVGSSYRSPRIDLREGDSLTQWSIESYFGSLRFLTGYSATPTEQMRLANNGYLYMIGEGAIAFDSAGVRTVGKVPFGNGFFQGTLTGDIAFRGASGNLHFGVGDGSAASTMQVGASSVGVIGDIVFASPSYNAWRGVRGVMGDNDHWRIMGMATAGNNGFLEIATADDGTEPIYVRQYSSGVFGTIARTLTLLDGSGNTTLPGNLYPSGISGGIGSNSIGSNIAKWQTIWGYAGYFDKLYATGISVTGTISFAQIAYPIVDVTTNSTLTNASLSLVNSASDLTLTLPNPSAGLSIKVVVRASGANGHRVYPATSHTITWSGMYQTTYKTYTAYQSGSPSGQACLLLPGVYEFVGVSSSEWALTSTPKMYA
jgi:hypothetical protein